MQLTKLISPVIVATAASLLALSATTVFFTNQLDTNSLEAEQRTVARLVAGVPRNLTVLAEDNSWWDEAIDNIHLTENQAWISATLGGTVEGIGDLEGAVILRPDTSILYSVHRDDNPADVGGLLSNGLKEAVDSLEPAEADVGVSTMGYATSKGRVFALGISMVQPSGSKVFDPPLGNRRRPVLIFYREVNQDQIRSFSQASELRDFGFRIGNDTTSVDYPDAKVRLTGLDGKSLGYFLWTPSRPGAKLLQQLLWPAVFLTGLIIIAAASFVRRAQMLINDLAQADRTKMAFLASMSHEVRTPLNAIIGFAEILRLELHGEIKGEKNREYLDIIRTSGEHLLTVINDILNISKLDAGKMEVFAEAMDPVEVISESVRIIETSARERSIRLITELESGVIVSDERIIRQILINILSNAIKFTASGGQVSVRSEIADDGYRITISDTGIGMSKGEIDVALAPFGQVKNKNQTTSVGTGLGLPLVNRFITLIGGEMTIRSAPGHGTSVRLDLPKAPPKKAHKTDDAQGLF